MTLLQDAERGQGCYFLLRSHLSLSPTDSQSQPPSASTSSGHDEEARGNCDKNHKMLKENTMEYMKLHRTSKSTDILCYLSAFHALSGGGLTVPFSVKCQRAQDKPFHRFCQSERVI